MIFMRIFDNFKKKKNDTNNCAKNSELKSVELFTANGVKLPQGYNIPNGCDINIFCKYTDELASYFNEELIKQFFKEYQKNVIVSVEDDKSFKFINITEESSNSEISSEYWDIFDDDSKNEYIEGLENNTNEINIINQCNSILLFNCRTKEEVILVLYLSLYMSNYTDSIIVCDNYNGFDLKPFKNELANMTIKR